jgi:2-iminobutanoate/2-iminopropanoate deaminase
MRVLIVAAALALAGCVQAVPDDQAATAASHEMESHAPEFINLVEPWPYPFSSAVRSGPFLFVSGQIGSRVVDGSPVLVEGGIEAETRQALENIKTIVEHAGASMDHVVKCTVMIADMAEWPAMNGVYETFFPGSKPARAAFGASGLALDARVEIDCIAVVE